MIVIAAVGGLAFVLAASIVGLRLLWLSRKTRQLPEFAIGTGLFLMGALGYPLMVIARQATSWSDETRAGLVILNQVLSLVGMTLLATFNWRVFRPDSAIARALVAATALTYMGMIVAQGATAGWVAFAHHGIGPWNGSAAASIFVLGWAGGESLRYHTMMRRRQRLGLADPVLVDRFRLWAVGILAACLTSAISVGLREMGIDIRGSAAGALVIGPLGVLAAGSMWLAFIPPASYTRWIAARHAQPQGG